MRDDTITVSIMHVNNEIGVVQDIATIGEMCRARGIIYHVDAAERGQAAYRSEPAES